MLIARIAPAASEPLAVAVGYAPLSAPFYVAEHQGYFKAEGVDVRIEDCAFGRLCLELLLSGKVQLATVAESPIVLASIEGTRLAILATTAIARRDVKIIARQSGGIRAAADLSGKRIGTFIGTTAHYFLHLVMLLAGGDPSDIQVLPLKSDEDLVARMKGGELDAVAVFEPYGYQVVRGLQSDAKVISSSAYAYTWNLLSTPEVALARERDVEGVLRALERATRFIEKNSRRAREILQLRTGAEPAAIDWVWSGLSFGLTLDQWLLHTLEGQARWALRFGYASGTVPDFRAYLFPGPLSRVKPQVKIVPRSGR